MTLPAYEIRYCAFVDILGFSSLVERLGHGTTSFDALRRLLRKIHEPPKSEHITNFKNSDLRAQSISDAVCISTKCNGSGLSHLFYVLEELTLELLSEGFFIRGAIVKGQLYHDDKMVFGEALVRAYRIESEIARYPRIMVASDVVEDANALLENDQYGLDVIDSIDQAEDGPRYLNSLSQIDIFLRNETNPEQRLKRLERYNGMADQIQHRFNEAFDNPRHFEKVQWFARYWNRAATPFGVNRIYGPGLEPPAAIWE